MKKIFVDIETYSPYDLKKTGVYKYALHSEFEILMVAAAVDDGEVWVYTIQDFIRFAKEVQGKAVFIAHSATFERICFKRYGLDIPIKDWICTMALSAYCGLPLSLAQVSKVLNLGESGKLGTGTALINYFSKPCKPTKANGGRLRNLPAHNPEKWAEFEKYCVNDVIAEREIFKKLEAYSPPELEKTVYRLDQIINDQGVFIDMDLVKNIINVNQAYTEKLIEKATRITGLSNPNSLTQLKEWLNGETGEVVTSLTKANLPDLIKEAGAGDVGEVLEIRQKLSKTSVKKYQAMENCADASGVARGLFQYYGARTGRWTGRLIQLQNLPQNHLSNLDQDRNNFKELDFDSLSLMYEDISEVSSQLIRTAIVPKPGTVFAVADFSSIESRVTAWLAGEKWRLDIFSTHGKIYEASAAAMFGVSIEAVTKGSDLRQKGKIAELALGFGGSVGALASMGGESMGLSTREMYRIVNRWRAASPKIVKLWSYVEDAFKAAIRNENYTLHLPFTSLYFEYNGEFMTIQLPSKRKLFYYKPEIKSGRIIYQGNEKGTKTWGQVDTWAGKLVENLVQGIARDLLAEAIYRLHRDSFTIVMHVHDEVVCEVYEPTFALAEMISIMKTNPSWAKGLPLNADGFITNYYKKD